MKEISGEKWRDIQEPGGWRLGTRVNGNRCNLAQYGNTVLFASCSLAFASGPIAGTRLAYPSVSNAANAALAPILFR